MEHFISTTIFLALVLLSLQVDGTEATIRSSVNEAESRAQQTMQGLFHYYWRNDAQVKKIGFFFACGQIGGADGGGSCTCENSVSCTSCYRWWDAVAMESVASYGIYTNSTNNSYITDNIFAHSPYNSNWPGGTYCTFIDDFAWYGIAYLRVYEWLKDTEWLNRSRDLHDWVWEYGWKEPCGGFYWMNCGSQTFKDSITNVEMLHLSSKLAYLFPNESRYLDQAKKIWDWFFSFDGGYGLMSDKYLVSTGAIPVGCCNATIANSYLKCHNSKVSGTSYNQGLLISSSAYLYRRTGDKTYLNVGLRAVDAILMNYTTKEGILIDEPRSYQTYQSSCLAGQDPGGDWYSFNGIFMLHLGYFIDLLHEDKSLPTEALQNISNFIEKTSDAAWSRSAVWPPFKKGVDGCDIGGPKPNPNITFPKFHWWWGQKVTQQIIPPDPQRFFHNSFIRCHSVGAVDAQIWEGNMATEDKCKTKCHENTECSKYLYNDNGAVPGLNCWLWSYNRTDHSCHESADKWYLGVKRPPLHASCAGKCGSKEAQVLESGGVCYCDSQCASHMDCCLDYADYCRSDNRTVSCKGMCKKVEAQPIPGGGYCWCFDGCNPWMTDNNSDGSCCTDYPEQCLSVDMPACLDARSQGSALNLFIAHLKLTQITSKVDV